MRDGVERGAQCRWRTGLPRLSVRHVGINQVDTAEGVPLCNLVTMLLAATSSVALACSSTTIVRRLTDLWQRFEIPDDRQRWDAPLVLASRPGAGELHFCSPRNKYCTNSTVSRFGPGTCLHECAYALMRVCVHLRRRCSFLQAWEHVSLPPTMENLCEPA